MRLLFIIFFLSFFVNAKAQNASVKDSSQMQQQFSKILDGKPAGINIRYDGDTDSPVIVNNYIKSLGDKKFPRDTTPSIRIGPCVGSFSDVEILFVVDEKKHYGDNNLKSLIPDVNDIIDVKVLKGKDATALYGTLGKGGVVIVTTKTFAKRIYQKKIGSFSGAYKKYLAGHHNDDTRLNYIIDGNILAGNSGIKRLYNFQADSIHNVSFLQAKDFEGFTTSTVIITTKK